MNTTNKILSLLAAVASFVLTSCGSSFYNRSSSKGGMVESGGSQFFNPFANMVNVQIGGALVAGGGGYCPPSAPYYGGGGYRRPAPCPPPGYGMRPQPYPPGYGMRPPGYGMMPPRRPYYGSAGNGILMGGAGGMYEFSDQFPGGRRVR